MPSYLRRRGCTWFFRWKWPKRLAANHGSGELIRSLKTGDYRTARRRALMLVLKIETMTSSMDNPSRAELETAVRGWIDACVWRREIRRAETGGLPAAEGEQQLSIERPSYGCPRMSKPPKLSKTDNTTRPDTKTEADVSASIGDNVDNVFDLPVIDEDTILTGAAADATDLDEKLKGLPRILRVAFLINQGSRDIHDRLVADIETLCPGLPLTAAFATVDDPATALDLAKELDRRAVADDVPELRHIADCVRLLSLPMQKDLAGSEDYRRVTQTLMNALARLPDDIDPQLAADIENLLRGLGNDPCAEAPPVPLPASCSGGRDPGQHLWRSDRDPPG